MADCSDNNLKQFGQNLRNIRNSKKLSTEKLANLADLDLAGLMEISLKLTT
jgi:transcriptional regulator with XRE-family HTH domain